MQDLNRLLQDVCCLGTQPSFRTFFLQMHKLAKLCCSDMVTTQQGLMGPSGALRLGGQYWGQGFTKATWRMIKPSPLDLLAKQKKMPSLMLMYSAYLLIMCLLNMVLMKRG